MNEQIVASRLLSPKMVRALLDKLDEDSYPHAIRISTVLTDNLRLVSISASQDLASHYLEIINSIK